MSSHSMRKGCDGEKKVKTSGGWALPSSDRLTQVMHELAIDMKLWLQTMILCLLFVSGFYKLWASCEQDMGEIWKNKNQQYMDKSRASNRSQISHECTMNKSWTSSEQVMNIQLTSCEQVKDKSLKDNVDSWISCEQFMSKYQVMNKTCTKLQKVMNQSGVRKWKSH